MAVQVITSADVVERVRLAAVDSGLSLAPGLVSPAVAGKCLHPVPLTLRSVAEVEGRAVRYEALTYGRCRKCRCCLAADRMKWAARCAVEAARTYRSWFWTCTFDWRHVQVAGQDPLDTAREKFTKAIKRLRKGFRGPPEKGFPKGRSYAAVDVRYLAVFERHKTGLPHIHCIVHEVSPGLTYRHLSRVWKHLGFCEAHVLDDYEGAAVAAGYAAKYIRKDAAGYARVRSSVGYGKIATRIGNVDLAKRVTSSSREEDGVPTTLRTEKLSSESAECPVSDASSVSDRKRELCSVRLSDGRIAHSGFIADTIATLVARARMGASPPRAGPSGCGDTVSDGVSGWLRAFYSWSG